MEQSKILVLFDSATGNVMQMAELVGEGLNVIDDLPEMIGWMKGEKGGGLLLGVASDLALGQCLLQFNNLSFGEVGVV